MSRLDGNNIKRTIKYIKRNGITPTFYKIRERLERDDEEAGYSAEAVASAPSEEELKQQRETVFIHQYRISILVPAFETDVRVFKDMVRSVLRQSYANWELIIADASKDETLKAVLNDYLMEFTLGTEGTLIDRSKIKYIHLDENKGISANSNAALDEATGEYIALLDHDDIITPDALYEVMKILDSKTSVCSGTNYRSYYRMVYSDEDKTNYEGTRYFDHHIKPKFDPYLIMTNNYICHFLVVETALVRGVGGFCEKYDGAQDHDLVLRCSEGIRKEEIAHIAKVLYHWRSSKGSTAENPDAKLYAYRAGRHAVMAHLHRMGYSAVVEDTVHLGFFRVRFAENNQPVLAMRRKEFDSLTEGDILRIKEEYIMVLGDDLEPEDPGYLSQMMTYMVCDDIAIVTGKLIGKDKKIESAGFAAENGGTRKPRFKGLNRHYSGYLHRASLMQMSDSVDYDCMLIRKCALKKCDGKIKVDETMGILYDPYSSFVRK